MAGIVCLLCTAVIGKAKIAQPAVNPDTGLLRGGWASPAVTPGWVHSCSGSPGAALASASPREGANSAAASHFWAPPHPGQEVTVPVTGTSFPSCPGLSCFPGAAAGEIPSPAPLESISWESQPGVQVTEAEGLKGRRAAGKTSVPKNLLLL